MSSGVRKVYRGTFTGTGASLDIKVVGFRPGSVRLFNETDVAAAEWSSSMADGSAIKEVTAGDKTFITAQGVTPLANGFNVGTDAVLNGAAKKIHYIAEE